MLLEKPTINQTPQNEEIINTENLDNLVKMHIDKSSSTTRTQSAIDKINPQQVEILKSERSNSKTGTRKRKKMRVTICTTNTRYDVIRRVGRKLGFKEVEDDDEWMLFWTDCSVSLDRVMSMKRFQKINHFPGMSEICRKDMLARNMNRLYKQYNKDYNIFPRTWVLPADYGDFQNYFRNKKGKCFIVKPEVGCQGKGIFVTKNPGKDIKATEHQVVQQYIAKPLLMDKYKFDLRIYVLVTSCDPLRIYIFKEGLVRLATVDYVDPTTTNTEDVCMHLTNYAINKNNENFIKPTGVQLDDSGTASKRSFEYLKSWFKENNMPEEQIFKEIHDLINKTVITAYPILKHNYRTCFPQPWKGSACFEILGFDILLDRKFKPWLLEVNHSPSFHMDSKLDMTIKTALIHDTMKILDIKAIDRKRCMEDDKKRVQARLTGPKSETREQKLDKLKFATNEWLKSVQTYEETNTSGFNRIYPPNSEEQAKYYKKFFSSSSSLFQTTTAQRARDEAARIQLEEIRLKAEIEKAKRSGKSISDINLLKGGESEFDVGKHVSTMSHSKLGKYGLAKIANKKRLKVKTCINILVPMVIIDSEENERKFLLRQRTSLLKSLGIIDIVHKMLDKNGLRMRVHCEDGKRVNNYVIKTNTNNETRDVSFISDDRADYSTLNPTTIDYKTYNNIGSLLKPKPQDQNNNTINKRLLTNRSHGENTTNTIKQYFQTDGRFSDSKKPSKFLSEQQITKSVAHPYNSLFGYNNSQIYNGVNTFPHASHLSNDNFTKNFSKGSNSRQQAPSIPTLQNSWRRSNQPNFALTIRQIGGPSGSNVAIKQQRLNIQTAKIMQNVPVGKIDTKRSGWSNKMNEKTFNWG